MEQSLGKTNTSLDQDVEWIRSKLNTFNWVLWYQITTSYDLVLLLTLEQAKELSPYTMMINSKCGHPCMLLPTRSASILIRHSHFLFIFFSFRFIWKLVALPVLSRGTFPLKKWTHICNKFLSLVFFYGIVFFCGATLTLTPTLTILEALLRFALFLPSWPFS